MILKENLFGLVWDKDCQEIDFLWLIFFFLILPKTEKYEKLSLDKFFYEKWYVYNISTTFLQQILSDRLLLVVIVGVKK